MKKCMWCLSFIMAAISLAGCPSGAVPGGVNSLTLHNQHNRNITEFSITKTGPVPGGTKAKVVGINLLQEELAPGDSFRVGNLADGEYSINVIFRDIQVLDSGVQREYCCNNKSATQVLEGGKSYDYYFKDTKSVITGNSIQTDSTLHFLRSLIIGAE